MLDSATNAVAMPTLVTGKPRKSRSPETVAGGWRPPDALAKP